MPKPLIQIDDLVREMTDEEFAQYEAQRLETKRLESEEQARIEARKSALAKLAAIGLTQEEIDAL